MLCHTGVQTPELRLGQAYLCMSLDTDNLNTVAQVVAGEGVIVFGSNMAGVTNLPDVEGIVSGPGPSEHLSCHHIAWPALPNDSLGKFTQ